LLTFNHYIFDKVLTNIIKLAHIYKIDSAAINYSQSS